MVIINDVSYVSIICVFSTYNHRTISKNCLKQQYKSCYFTILCQIDAACQIANVNRSLTRGALISIISEKSYIRE